MSTVESISLSLAPNPLSWRLQAHPLCSWISLHVRSVNPLRRDITIFTAAGAARNTVCGPDQRCPNTPAWCIFMYTQSPEFSLCSRVYLLLLMCRFHLEYTHCYTWVTSWQQDNIDSLIMARSLICDMWRTGLLPSVSQLPATKPCDMNPHNDIPTMLLK